MISIFAAYKNGLFTAWKEKKMLFLLYGFNLLFAYLITLPLSMMLTKALENTTAADKILHSFDFTIYTTIMDVFGKGVHLGRTITTFSILYLIINTFFAGGILKIIMEEKKFTIIDFLKGCVEYFNRFLRLFLLSVLSIIIAIIVFMIFSKILGLFAENPTSEHLPFLFFTLKILFLGFLLALINMIFDYAKIMTVVNDFHKMYSTIKEAVLFVMMSPRKTISLYFSYLMTTVLFLILYLVIESFISVTGWMSFIVFFLWTQIFMISRIWIRLSFFAGQYVLYRFSNTAMHGMTKEMLDNAVTDYEKRVAEEAGK